MKETTAYIEVTGHREIAIAASNFKNNVDGSGSFLKLASTMMTIAKSTFIQNVVHTSLLEILSDSYAEVASKMKIQVLK